VLAFNFETTIKANFMLSGSLSPQHGASFGWRWRNGLQLWWVAANILKKQLQTNDKGWYNNLGVGRGTTTLHHKQFICYEQFTQASDLDRFFG
jgi:hypothetical protein